jgi:hypothetical protein
MEFKVEVDGEGSARVTAVVDERELFGEQF